MTGYSFIGGVSLAPLYGNHTVVIDTYYDVGNGYSESLSGSFDAQDLISNATPFDPVDGIYNTGMPGPGDTVDISGLPEGELLPTLGPVIDIPVDAGLYTVETSGYYYNYGSDFEGYTNTFVTVSGVGGTFAVLNLGGPGQIGLASVTATTSASISGDGGDQIVASWTGVDSDSFAGFAPAQPLTISGGSLTTPYLTLTTGTSVAPQPNFGTPPPDIGTFTIQGTTLNGAVTQVSGDGESNSAADDEIDGTITLNGATLNATMQLDLIGNLGTDESATGTPELLLQNSTITAGAVVIATGTAGEGSATTGNSILSLTGGSKLTASVSTGDGSLIVGDSGQGTLLATGASTISDQQALIGNQPDSTGSATLDGGSWVNTGYIAVGNAGVGTLTVQNGASLSNTGQFGNGYIGGLEGSDGSMATITGKGSTWSLDQTLIVGSGGSGSLTIDQGGAVTVSDVLEIGLVAGVVGTIAVTNGSTLTANSQGGASTSSILFGDIKGTTANVTIDGSGSTLESMAAASIGYTGDGNLTLSNGGTFKEDASTIRVGRNEGSQSTLVITDSGSNLIGQSATLYVGYGGLGNALVESGGTINVAAVNLGGQDSGDGTLDIDGSAAMAALGTITVGDAGNGELDITNTASVTASALIIGNQDGGTGGVNVIGTSSLTVTGSVDIGMAAGSDGSITVSDADGGITYQGDLIIGDAGQGQLYLAQQVTATATDTVEVGNQDGSYGLLSIETGASFTANGTIDVGVEDGAIGLITLDGQNSSLTAQDAITIGDDGEGAIEVTGTASFDAIGTLTEGAQENATGTDMVANKSTSFHAHGDWILALAGDHSMDVSDQAQVQVDGAFTIGQEEDATGTLSLTDQDTTLTTGDGEVKIGDGGTGNVTVGPGATFDASNSEVTLGDQSSGAATFTLNGDTSTGNTSSGLSGELDADTLTVASSGSANLDASKGSTVSVTGDMSLGESADSTGIATLSDDGTGLTVGGDLTIGGDGTGILTVSASANASASGKTSIGEDTDGSGDLAIQGGEFDGSDEITIGSKGNGGIFVQLGGSLQASGGLSIGEFASGVGALNVNGGNATISGGDFTLGTAGQASLNITQSGYVNVLGTLNAATDSVGIVQTLSIDTGGTLFATGDLTLGEAGKASGVVIGGSNLIVAGNVTLGDQSNAGGTLSVVGTLNSTGASAPSIFTFGTLTVGNEGFGGLTILNGGVAGGPIGSTAPVIVQIGAMAEGSGDVSVTGQGSTLEATTLDVGSATGGQGTLDIVANGLVIANTASIADSGQLTLNNGTLNAAQLTISGGSLINATGVINGNVLGNGVIDIAQDGDLRINGIVGSSVAISFIAGNDLSLHLNQAGVFNGQIGAFTAGDIINLGTTGSFTSSFVNDVLLVVNGNVGVADIRFTGTYADGSIGVTQDGIVEFVSCYAEGTHIATPCGERAVEELREGDLVLTPSGRARPIHSVRHRHVECSRHEKPETVWPVRVHADAFGPGQPVRDLLLSPEHAVAQQGVLIPIHCLINGINITQERRGVISYWHVELTEHDLLLAENLPAESYLGADATPFAPIRRQGEAVEAVRAKLRRVGFNPPNRIPALAMG